MVISVDTVFFMILKTEDSSLHMKLFVSMSLYCNWCGICVELVSEGLEHG
jgi:hypothetical protein